MQHNKIKYRLIFKRNCAFDESAGVNRCFICSRRASVGFIEHFLRSALQLLLT
jgi:hypothetical protein